MLIPSHPETEHIPEFSEFINGCGEENPDYRSMWATFIATVFSNQGKAYAHIIMTINEAHIMGTIVRSAHL